MYKKQVCLFKWDCVINYNGNGAENKKNGSHRYHIKTCSALFPSVVFETAAFWVIVGLTAILRLLQRKNSTFL